MGNDQPVLFEKQTRLSQSRLWQQQRRYYQQQGVTAWVGQVPFHEANNPYIADTYASLIVAFIGDWVKQHPEAKQHPFYILELGAGLGQFAFYLVKRLREVLHELAMKDLKLRYIMSDFAQSNLESWLFHPALEEYFQEGMMDFALYDIEQDGDIRLTNKDEVLSPSEVRNPLIVIANNLFSVVPHDCFRVTNGKLYEALINIETDSQNIVGDGLKSFQDLKIEYNCNLITQDYYQEKDLDSVLNEYQANLAEGTLIYPLCVLRTIRKLLELSNNKLFMLCSDQGYATLDEMNHCEPPKAVTDGGLILPLNLHAIGQYYKYHGGDSFIPTQCKGLRTALFFGGMKIDALSQTKFAAKQYLEGFNPTDYCTLQKKINDQYQQFSVDEIAAFLNLSHWDPQLFRVVNRYICERLDIIDPTTVKYLCKNIEKVAKNFYFLPNAQDTLFDVAIFFHTNKIWDRAVQYYQKSQHFYSEQYGSTYNIGLCLFELGHLREAMCSFRKALELKPTAVEAKEWLEYVEKLRAENMTA